jgi:O-antigen/teichoic acid export membrane protein
MRLVGIVYQVSYPALCRLRDDADRFHAMFSDASRLIALVVTPILVGIGAVAEDFTFAVLGPQWAGMVVPLRLLAIAALINSLHALAGAAIEATGKVRYEVLTQGAYATLVVGGTYAGTRWGVEGVSMAVVGAALIFFVMKTATLRRAVGIPPSRFLATLVGPFAAALIMYGTVRAVIAAAASHSVFAPDQHWARLLAGTALGALAYGGALLVLARPHVSLLVDQLQRLRRESGRRPRARARPAG